MKKKYLPLFFILILTQLELVYGQDDYIPDKQWFTTPNVQSFNKFESIPVSYYTGNPNISVPIYTIQEGRINIPINLRYHASGIKVAEEASWVGLGWNLDVGGSVTRRVNGKNDEVWYDTDTNVYFLQYAKEVVNTSYLLSERDIECLAPYRCSPYTPIDEDEAWEDFEYKYGGYMNPPEWTYEDISDRGIAIAFGYYQPDIMSFSIPGKSGKFYFDYGEGKCFSIGAQEELNIESGEDCKWTITDSKGTKYYFNTPQDRESDYGDSRERSLTLTHYLDSIVYSNNQKVSFFYEQINDQVWTNNSIGPSVYRERYPWQIMNPSNHYCLSNGYYINSFTDFTGEKYTPTYLKMIKTENITIDFNRYNTPREDIDEEFALESIVIKNNQNEIIKQYSFQYDYFNDDSSDQYEKRLRLDKVFDNIGREYVFNYNNTIPSRRSFSRDYWGYYNAGSGDETFLADMDKFYQGLETPFWLPQLFEENTPPARNRGCDPEAMKAGVLEKITYPTGGYTIFDFEPHSFSNMFYAEKDESTIINSACCNASDTISVTTFSVDEIKYGKVYYSIGIAPINEETEEELINIMYKCYVEFYADDELVYSGETNLVEYNMAESHYYTFEPGVQYKLVAHATPAAVDHGYYGVYIKASYLENTNICRGGGLRVTSIRNYLHNDSLALQRKFFYEDSTISYGKLMSDLDFGGFRATYCPSYWDDMPGNIVGYYAFPYIELKASNQLAVSNNGTGNVVGYDQVIEEWQNDEGNGKVKYSYFNVPSENTFSNIPDEYKFKFNVEDIRNGLLQEVEYTNSDDKIVKKTINSYEEIQKKNHFGYVGYRDSLRHNCYIGYSFKTTLYRLPASTYKTTKVIDSIYFYDQENVKCIENIELLDYNKHLNVSASKKIASNFDTLKTQYIYPPDLLEGSSAVLTDDNALAILEMVNNNEISSPLQIIEKKENKVTKGNLNLYKINNSGVVVQDKFLGLELLKPLTSLQETTINGVGELDYSSSFEENALIDDTDKFGNIILYHLSNNIYTTFLWGYNYTKPVAKIENATYNDVLSALGITYEELQTKSSTELQALFQTLRNHSSMTNAMVYSYTYKPLIGMETQTDPNGTTVFYEYDEFHRLKTIIDEDGNILKHHKYHYIEDQQ